jgi:hypothetical protein
MARSMEHADIRTTTHWHWTQQTGRKQSNAKANEVLLLNRLNRANPEANGLFDNP